MTDIPDVDIDVSNRQKAVSVFAERAVAASLISNGSAKKHPVGVYLQKIPVNPLNGCSAFAYGHAEDVGYYKVDVIPVTVYNSIESPEHLRRLMAEPIDWSWFEDKDFVSRLFQISRWTNVIIKYKPKSILDLAILVAIIRPAKIYLLGEPWEVIREKIWLAEPVLENQPRPFKKSHAVAYAMVVGLDARIQAKEFFTEKTDD